MHCSVGPCNLGKSCADLGSFRWRHPIGIDGRHAGLADAAQQRFAKVGIFDDSGGMIMQAAAYSLRVRPASDHMRDAQAHEFVAGIRQLLSNRN